MHSYIFQVFESPCPQKKWASEEIFWEHPDALPVANGTSPVEDRTIAIASLGKWLADNRLGKLSGETFMVNTQAADRHFEGRFIAFQQAISALQQLDERQFLHEHDQVQNLIDNLSRTFTDKYDAYMLVSSSIPPLPMDEFIRKAQLNMPYYIGTVLDFCY